MKIGDKLTIQRTLNGYLVMPEIFPNEPVDPANFMVFQELGYGNGNGEGHPTTLLEFLAMHFDPESIKESVDIDELV